MADPPRVGATSAATPSTASPQNDDSVPVEGPARATATDAKAAPRPARTLTQAPSAKAGPALSAPSPPTSVLYRGMLLNPSGVGNVSAEEPLGGSFERISIDPERRGPPPEGWLAPVAGFMDDDVGVSKRGDLASRVMPHDVGTWYFVDARGAVFANVDPHTLTRDPAGGVKVNYHRDLVGPGGVVGYVRAAAGAHTSVDESGGAKSRVVVAALKIDERAQKPYELVHEHLRLTLGGDADLLLTLPITASGARPQLDKLRANTGTDVMLSGTEQLAPGLQVLWAVRSRYVLDVVRTGMATQKRDAAAAEKALGRDPWRAQFALAVVHRSEHGLVTRVDVGGTCFVRGGHAPAASATETHYAALTFTPSDSVVEAGVFALGDRTGGKEVLARDVGVALALTPNEHWRFEVSSEAAAAGVRRLTDQLVVNGSIETLF